MLVIRPEPTAWTVTCTACAHAGAPAGIVGHAFPSTVPGCVHLDLERAGLIPSIDSVGGEAAQEWVGHADWRWHAAIPVDDAAASMQVAELVFESIDTVARVAVDGADVGESQSQWIEGRFDVTGQVRDAVASGRTAIGVSVTISAPVPHVRAEERRLGPRPVNGDWTPYPFMRKSACNFGWDWGPRVPTSGIPGDVRLECWSVARLASVRPMVRHCDAASARVEVHMELARPPGAAPPPDLHVRAELRMPPRESGEDPTAAGRAQAAARRGPAKLVATVPVDAAGRAMATFDVERPSRWWPRGMGTQPLHALHVETADAAGRPLPRDGGRSRQVRRIGLRSCALDTGADEHGSRFRIVVNGRPVPVVGANWIPASPWPVRGRDDAAIDALLDRAALANLNMLRVWGGGIYEHPRFYDRCDELGILVWQDFMFACATYPEDDPMPALVEREARQQIARLCAHPSIVLWCGGNEDVLAWQSWGFRERLAPGQTWGIGFWQDLLPRICAELDPSRPYWTDSPWSGSLDRHANDPDHGDRHTWDLKLGACRDLVPRFTSEFGHQSPPCVQSLCEVLGDGWSVGSPEWERRQRAWGGDSAQYAPFLAGEFRPPADDTEWVWQAQAVQARAMEDHVAWLRSNPGRNGGSLFWQLNDVWTGHSWSVIDGRGRTKPAYHAVQRAAAPRLVTLQPVGAPGSDGRRSLRVVLVNDAASRWSAKVRLRAVDPAGRTIGEALRAVRVEPWSVDCSIDAVDVLGGPGAGDGAACLVADVAVHEDQVRRDVPLPDRPPLRGWWWFGPDRTRPARHADHVEVRVEPWMGGQLVRVAARALVRDLWVEPIGDWVECGPNGISLLPGERALMAIRMRHDPAAGVRVHWS
ncbi:MAG: hypothetical protein RI990_1654 [Planctomycetota bacterium]